MAFLVINELITTLTVITQKITSVKKELTKFEMQFYNKKSYLLNLKMLSFKARKVIF